MHPNHSLLKHEIIEDILIPRLWKEEGRDRSKRWSLGCGLWKVGGSLWVVGRRLSDVSWWRDNGCHDAWFIFFPGCVFFLCQFFFLFFTFLFLFSHFFLHFFMFILSLFFSEHLRFFGSFG